MKNVNCDKCNKRKKIQVCEGNNRKKTSLGWAFRRNCPTEVPL